MAAKLSAIAVDTIRWRIHGGAVELGDLIINAGKAKFIAMLPHLDCHGMILQIIITKTACLF
ncbi:MAG: hypothetical protein ACFB12_10605 [Leptolyngbyaceae cyanobacterium]